jgi:hypothetical protein
MGEAVTNNQRLSICPLRYAVWPLDLIFFNYISVDLLELLQWRCADCWRDRMQRNEYRALPRSAVHQTVCYTV